MALADALSGYTPSRSGWSNPNWLEPEPLKRGEGFLKTHEQRGFFEDNPGYAYQAAAPLWGSGRKAKRISEMMTPIFAQYTGKIAQDLLAGNNPQYGWAEFIHGGAGQDPFDFDQFYRDYYPGASEQTDAIGNPRIRYMY